MNISFLSFSPTFTAQKILRNNSVSSVSNTIKLPATALPTDVFELNSQEEVQTIDEILEDLRGTVSKEDLKNIEFYKEKYSKMDAEQEYKRIILNLKREILKYYTPTKEDGKKLVSNDKLITTSSKERMRNLIIEAQSILLLKPDIDVNVYKQYCNSNLGIQNNGLPYGIYLHPVDRACDLVGNLTKEDFDNIQKFENKYKRLNMQQILNKKLDVLGQLYAKLQTPKADFWGCFTQKDLQQIKHLITKYEALDRIHLRNGISSFDYEKILFSSTIPHDVEKGDYINGLGLVLNRLNVDGVDAIITFSDSRDGRTLTMYNLDELSKGQVFLDRYEEEEINKLNSAAKEIVENEKKAFMSEVVVAKCQSDTLNDIEIKDEKVKDIIAKNKTAYTITDFMNFDNKRYPSAAKILGIRVLQLLKENDFAPVFIVAHPFNNSKHSPVRMYQRIGFKPFSHTSEEIDELEKNKGSMCFDDEIYMYVNNFKDLKTLNLLIKHYKL